MAKKRKQYDSVFKQKAVERADARGNVREVAAELGISPDFIYLRKSEAKTYGLGSSPRKGRPKMTAHESELADLKKKLRDAEMERDILKRGHYHLLLERSERLSFMMRHANEFSIELMCAIFKISETNSYTWRKNPRRPHAEKRRQILEFILEGRKDRKKQVYGSPGWTKELQAPGFIVSEGSVARLMKSQGIKALKRRPTKSRPTRTTRTRVIVIM